MKASIVGTLVPSQLRNVMADLQDMGYHNIRSFGSFDEMNSSGFGPGLVVAAQPRHANGNDIISIEQLAKHARGESRQVDF